MNSKNFIEIDDVTITGIAGCYIEIPCECELFSNISPSKIYEINSRFKKDCDYSDLKGKMAEINYSEISIF